MNRQWRESLILEISNKYQEQIRATKPKNIEDCIDILTTYNTEMIKYKEELKPRRWRRKLKLKRLKQKCISVITKNYNEEVTKVGNDEIIKQDRRNEDKHMWVTDWESKVTDEITETEEDKENKKEKETEEDKENKKEKETAEDKENKEEKEIEETKETEKYIWLSEVPEKDENSRKDEDRIINKYIKNSLSEDNSIQESIIEQNYQETIMWGNNPYPHKGLDTIAIKNGDLEEWEHFAEFLSTGTTTETNP